VAYEMSSRFNMIVFGDGLVIAADAAIAAAAAAVVVAFDTDDFGF